MYSRGVLIEVAPRSWLILGLLGLGAAVCVALLVMLLVGSDRFDDSSQNREVPRGTCEPFCYDAGSPGVTVPPPPAQYPMPGR